MHGSSDIFGCDAGLHGSSIVPFDSFHDVKNTPVRLLLELMRAHFNPYSVHLQIQASLAMPTFNLILPKWPCSHTQQNKSMKKKQSLRVQHGMVQQACQSKNDQLHATFV